MSEELHKAREDLQVWLERGEILWRQRSKALWLKEGDQNTRYFHRKASQRKKRNEIIRLKDNVVAWKDGQNSLSQ